MDIFLSFIKENKDSITIIITTVISFIGLLTFIKAIIEYKLQGRQKRAEIYQKFDEQFNEEKIKKIVELLEGDNEKLKSISIIDRYHFLGFYEKIAMTLNSKLMTKNVAHYMFGYFALRCLESQNFWNGINKNSYYWSNFIVFAKKMKEEEKRQIEKNLILKFYDKIVGRNSFKY